MKSKLHSSLGIMGSVGLAALLTAASCSSDDAGGGGAGGSDAAIGQGGQGASSDADSSRGGADAAAGATGTGGSTAGASSGGAANDSGIETSTPSDASNDVPLDVNLPPLSWPPPALKLTKVAEGLEAPVLAISAPGDATRMFIVEQTGHIRVLKNGAVLPDTFLDVTVNYDGKERGLLGLAFHPDYATNKRLWVYYTNGNGDNVVAEYKRSDANADKAAGLVKELFTISHPGEANHNGGMLAFGFDGKLYVSTGDGGSGGDPNNHGQSLDTKLGKILRVDVDTYPTAVPGNITTGSEHSIWDYGLRNPWRFSFDRLTGDLYIGDVGQGDGSTLASHEEVDVELRGAGNKNYGWRKTEGLSCYPPGTDNCDKTGLTDPVTEFSQIQAAMIGGYVYRGTAIPELAGTYFFGDEIQSRIWALQWQNGKRIHDKLELTDALASHDTLNHISCFGQDAAGEVYVCSYAATGGKLFRIDKK